MDLREILETSRGLPRVTQILVLVDGLLQVDLDAVQPPS